MVTRNVAEKKVAFFGVPKGAFGKAKTRGDFLELNFSADDRREAWIPDFNAHFFLPSLCLMFTNGMEKARSLVGFRQVSWRIMTLCESGMSK